MSRLVLAHGHRPADARSPLADSAHPRKCGRFTTDSVTFNENLNRCDCHERNSDGSGVTCPNLHRKRTISARGEIGWRSKSTDVKIFEAKRGDALLGTIIFVRQKLAGHRKFDAIAFCIGQSLKFHIEIDG